MSAIGHEQGNVSLASPVIGPREIPAAPRCVCRRGLAWRGVIAFVLGLSFVVSAQAAAPTCSPGLGDNQNTLHYVILFRNHPSGLPVYYTFDQALDMYRQVYNFTNGTHSVSYGAGWEAGSAWACPYFNEDTVPPFDKGFQKFRNLIRGGYRYNADTGLYLDTHLAGPLAFNNRLIADKDKALDAKGNWKTSWSGVGGRMYNLSIRNRIDNGNEWATLQGFVDNFGMNHSVHTDALNPDSYSIHNESTSLGGKITTKAQEWTAVLQEMDHLWNSYAIGNFTEFVRTEYRGHVFGFFGGYGDESPSNYLNIWGNSVLFMSRTGSDLAKDMAWGSEWGPRYPGSPGGNAGGYPAANVASLRRLYYRNALQYFYMQKYVPESYADNAKTLQVRFSGNLVSEYDKTSGRYQLYQTFPDRTVSYADGTVVAKNANDDPTSTYCRFVPQVGAGCKIIAYSKVARPNASWTLPPTWDGMTSVDRYITTLDKAPTKVDTLTVTNRAVTFDMAADAGYVLVPAGNGATPLTVMFNDKHAGDILMSYAGIIWDVAGNPAMKVWQADAKGGFSSNSAYVDSASTALVTVNITLPEHSIMHSLRVGTSAGAGAVRLHSSTAGNDDVTLTLPAVAETALLETNWKYAETGDLSISITNRGGCRNTLLDNFIYLSGALPVPKPASCRSLLADSLAFLVDVGSVRARAVKGRP